MGHKHIQGSVDRAVFSKADEMDVSPSFAGFNVISVDIHYTVYKADVLREVWTRFTNCGP